MEFPSFRQCQFWKHIIVSMGCYNLNLCPAFETLLLNGSYYKQASFPKRGGSHQQSHLGNHQMDRWFVGSKGQWVWKWFILHSSQ